MQFYKVELLFWCQVFQKFPELHGKISLHLVEVSPALSKIQEQTLTGKLLSIQEGKKEGQTDATDDRLQANEVQHKILILKVRGGGDSTYERGGDAWIKPLKETKLHIDCNPPG